MSNLYKYSEFLNEATLGLDKVGVNYQLSRPGREKAFKLSSATELESFNIKFEHTDEVPSDTDDVLYIKGTSFVKLNYLDFKELYKIDDDGLMIYKLISDDIDVNWAVAKIGQQTNVLRQLSRTGASKRGDYFRETAFLIKLAEIAWREKGVKLKIYSNRGEVEMDYKEGGIAEMSRKNTVEFRNAYYDFVNKTKKSLITAMDDHCLRLIGYLGDKISNVKYITKNSSDYIINKLAITFMRDEAIEKSKMAIETGFDFDIPSKANVSKWNPSDIWIVFDDEYFSSEKSYLKRGIDNICDLNNFLYKSLMKRTGIVGVSLKMSKGKANLFKITGDTRLINRFSDFDISNSKKTADIDFDYKKESDEKWYKGAGIDCRTFDSSTTSSISLEVKGKKGAGYVSGKAGSIINHLMPDNYFRIKDILRKEKSKETLRAVLSIDFDRMGKDKKYKPVYLPSDDRLRKVFLEDLKGDGDKNSAENSRLQSVVFLDWLLSLSENDRNSVITTVVRYAKSESLWSAPHLVLK